MSRNRPLFLYLFLPIFFIMVALAFAVGSYTSSSAKKLIEDKTHRLLISQAQFFATLLSKLNTSADTTSMQSSFNTAAVDSLCELWRKKTLSRFTVILPDGTVIGDSHKPVAQLDNHADRPEIIAARESGFGNSIRYSISLEKKLHYVAVPVFGPQEKNLAIARVSQPIDMEQQRSWRIVGIITAMFIVASLFSLILAVVLVLQLRRRNNNIIEAIHDIIEEKQDYRTIPPSAIYEFNSLSTAINELIETQNQKNEKATLRAAENQAILSSMVEGVIAIDTTKKIFLINEAALRLLDKQREDVLGRWVHEVIRSSVVKKLVSKKRIQQGPQSAEVKLTKPNAEEISIVITASNLQTVRGRSNGAVIMLHDVTQIRKLEQMRRDFVANVSHELRTPLTSIKGFVETLQQGAIDEPRQAHRFMGIIEQHVNRLHTIIEDLLLLSQLEQQQEEEKPFQPCDLKQLCEHAITLCSERALKKNIRIEYTGSEHPVSIQVIPSLIEQAIANIITNAIKYSGAETTVTVSVYKKDAYAVVSVLDHGQGIAAEHIPRLFERFYRIDKARSRKEGGTGLGLSIVKHILTLHNGYIDVASTVGVGSTFTLHVPLKATEDEETR